jgi:hypothetical protein
MLDVAECDDYAFIASVVANELRRLASDNYRYIAVPEDVFDRMAHDCDGLWEDISTYRDDARDGWVLLVQDGLVWPAIRDCGVWRGGNSEDGVLKSPTHWRPLPQAPLKKVTSGLDGDRDACYATGGGTVG